MTAAGPLERQAPKKSLLRPRFPGPAGLSWTESRISALEALWGESNLIPGGEEFELELVKPVGLTAEMTVLDLNAGVGGSARRFVAQYGCWVTGLTTSRELAEMGQERSTRAGMGRKATVSHFSPDSLDLKRTRFNCIFARELLHRITDKEPFCSLLAKALKPTGHLILTDFLSGRPEVGRDGEFADCGVGTDLCSLAAYRALLESFGLHVWVAEEITSRYRALAEAGLRAFLNSGAVIDDASTRIEMAEEVARWRRIFDHFESGHLAAGWFYATKSGENPRDQALRWSEMKH